MGHDSFVTHMIDDLAAYDQVIVLGSGTGT